MKEAEKKVGAVCVVGGGIAGMAASLDLAESGFKVYLVEKSPSIGGIMAQLDKTFPTNDCAMCTLAPRMIDAGNNPNIEKLTYSEVVSVKGDPGRFTVQIKKKARSIDAGKCTGCGECTQRCPVRYLPRTVEEDPIAVSPEEKERVDALVKQYSGKKAPLLSILQAINAEYNYLPEGCLRYASAKLGVPLAHILRVASFYTLFSLKPRGKHVVSVCMGTACFARGSERIMDRLKEVLQIGVGDMTKDRKFSLDMVRCIGCCALAPVLKVGEEIHAKVRTKDVEMILKGYQK